MPGTDTLKLVGRTIADKYAVEGVVGEGGFATVYKATHILWKRPVALKVFKALSEWSASDRQRLLDEFIQEGALLADLSARTAAIVQARDIGMLETANGERVPYMVLEWLEGGTLEAVLEDEKRRGLAPRTIADTVRLIEPAAEALALAHRKGIAHRDVKPGNIFVIGDPRGDVTVKLLDFGIAKVVSDMQKIAGSFAKAPSVNNGTDWARANRPFLDMGARDYWSVIHGRRLRPADTSRASRRLTGPRSNFRAPMVRRVHGPTCLHWPSSWLRR